MYNINIKKEDWHLSLEKLLSAYEVFVPVKDEYSLDYEPFRLREAGKISYNYPKPATPLKNFFLPVRENVTSERGEQKPRVIIGVPNCDIEALKLLDEIYMEESFPDPFYRNRRNNTIIISTDCFAVNDHCHCLTYGVKPWPSDYADIALVADDEDIYLRVMSSKGEEFASQLSESTVMTDSSVVSFIEEKHKAVEDLLAKQNKGLPDYMTTGEIVRNAGNGIWEKYSSKCVSCGACTTICPTCSCFLLIDKPGFEKVKQMDACQYPGFERVAGGDDPLFELQHRFRNRYMCKYVWKPQKFNAIACTGCGRCIEACIGKINKNELFMELV
jgi:ferredoxin